MERWELRPSPGAGDPDRHVLLLKGGPADVAALIKRFGALLGRPSPCRREGFNYSLALHRLTPASRAKLEAWLEKACPSAKPAPEAAPPTPAPSKPAPAPRKAAAPKPVPAEPPAPAGKPASEPSPSAPASGALAAAGALPLRPEWTFDSLLVGAWNRFAHAAAMSVVASPGAMYNPLFLYGPPGAGKSHFLHAVGDGLSKALGGPVLAVSAPRLARAAESAANGGTLRAFESAAEGARALLIDDIHLLAVSETNAGPLASFLRSFFDRHLQVVVSSLYPPRALAPLEESLKVSFSKGWSVDLKIPAPAAQKEIVAAAADRSGVLLSAEELGLLHEKLSQWGYPSLTLWLRRVAVFKKALEAAGKPAALAELLPLIYEPVLAGASEAPPEKPRTFEPPAGGGEPLAVLAPKGEEALGRHAAALFHEAGSQPGAGGPYRYVLWSSYDAAQPAGTPFALAETCRREAISRALIVGPAPGSPLGARAAEFEHVVRRLLESLDVRVGWIPLEGLSLPAHYLNARLDLAPDPR